MFEIVNITSKFAIGPQPSIKDFDVIRAAGFASLLNARPDDEQGEYLRSHEAKACAKAVLARRLETPMRMPPVASLIRA